MTNTEFNIGVIKPVECVKEAWELIKPNYWLLFAIWIVGAMIGGVSLYILIGAMVCGIYKCYLNAIDGQKVEFEALFKGFSYFLPSLLVTILIVVPMFILIAIMYVPLIMSTIMGNRLSQSELMTMMLSSLGVELVFTVIMVCLHTLLMFAFPLIVDRNLSGWQAVKLSAKAVWKNLGGVAGLFGVLFGLSLLGYLALCVGLYLVIPVIIASQLVAYRKVFPSTNAQTFNNPPPPDTFNL